MRAAGRAKRASSTFEGLKLNFESHIAKTNTPMLVSSTTSSVHP